MVFSISRIALFIVLQLGFYNYSNLLNSVTKAYSGNLSEKNALSDENPVISPQNIIFEVKHSKTTNVVVYQANKTISNFLNPEKPIDVFWLLNTRGKKVETLTTIEWRMAYGYKLKTIIAGKKYTITLNAIDSKVITIEQNETGKVDAFMIINGIYSKLSGVFIDYEYSFYLPNVKYIEFTGHAVSSNKVVVERVSA
jgi:hypothetical protein